MKIDWPEFIALLQPVTPAAFVMRKLKEESVQVSVTVGRAAAAGPVMAFCREFSCDICHAYYLPRIVVEPQSGAPLPQGTLTLTLDGESILEEPLSFFLQRPESPDFLETYPWKAADGVLPAVVAVGEDQAQPSRRIGTMIPNASMVEITLRDLVAQEKTTLKIGIPLAKYSTLLPENEKENR